MNRFTEDLDDYQDLPEDQEDTQESSEAPHPANPATVPQAPPDMITVALGPGERLNLSIRMTMLMEEAKEEKKLASKHTKKAKELQEEIDKLAVAVRTGSKEVPNTDQQDLLQQPVGGDAAAAALSGLAAQAEGALAAANAATAPAEPPEWKPQHHQDTCPAKKGPLHGCNCGWNQAHGGPVEGEEFQASEEELAKQSGRKGRGKRAA